MDDILAGKSSLSFVFGGFRPTIKPNRKSCRLSVVFSQIMDDRVKGRGNGWRSTGGWHLKVFNTQGDERWLLFKHKMHPFHRDLHTCCWLPKLDGTYMSHFTTATDVGYNNTTAHRSDSLNVLGSLCLNVFGLRWAEQIWDVVSSSDGKRKWGIRTQMIIKTQWSDNAVCRFSLHRLWNRRKEQK